MSDERGLFSAAKDLARNPLGIVALFIMLIYGFATLLLGAAADTLKHDEKMPLIWFVVLFPGLVLGAFYRLVTKHHGKLYAPKDYKSDTSFLKTLPQDQQADRLDDEIASMESNVVSPETGDKTSFELSAETVRPAGTSDVDSLKQRYLLAESLAFKKLQAELGLSFQSNMTFGRGRATAFDGVAQDGLSFVVAEVKYLRRPLIPPTRIREALYRGFLASTLVRQESANADFRMMIILVLDFAGGPEVFSHLQRRGERLLRDAPFPVDLRVYGFEDLKREFNISDEGPTDGGGPPS